MRLKISHTTHYRYHEPPSSVIELMRLTPRNSACQSVREWGIQVSTDSTLRRFEDAFGNVNHTFSIPGPLDEVIITAVGTVETENADGVLAGSREPLPVGVFLRATELTDRSAALEALARTAVAASDGSKLATLHALNATIHERMTVATGLPSSTATADAALARGEGLSQDCAHIFIAAARASGIPTRYATGYRHNRGGDAIGRTTHAWAEAHIADLGWVGFDPTSNQSPDDAYVRVAVGLDYLSAAPVRGAMYGGSGETLDVSVTVEEISNWGPSRRVQRQIQS